MSTIKVTNIEHESTGNGGIQLDSSGHVIIDGVQMPSSGALSHRNLLINGAMIISQRGTSFSSSHNNNNYGLDRWQVLCPNTSATIVHSQESTGGPDGFKNWLKASPSVADTNIASSDYGFIQQKIEGYNFAPARFGFSDAKKLTLSFRFKTNKAGTYCWMFRNSAANRNLIHEFTPVADGNWQTISFTIPGDTGGTWLTDNGVGLNHGLCIANGSSLQSSTTDTWFQGQYYHSTPNQVNFLDSTSNELGITGIQMEIGEVATEFEHRSHGEELARCQRYYYRHADRASDEGRSVGTFAMYQSSRCFGAVHFPVTMRATPTLDASDFTNAFKCFANANNQGFDGFAGIQETGTTNCVIESDATLSLTAAAGAWVRCEGSTAQISFNAEI
tara:strand:- start:285 stop:1451 length:1167 start_codon:yes stop_codon:yes gene_type:complete